MEPWMLDMAKAMAQDLGTLAPRPLPVVESAPSPNDPAATCWGCGGSRNHRVKFPRMPAEALPLRLCDACCVQVAAQLARACGVIR